MEKRFFNFVTDFVTELVTNAAGQEAVLQLNVSELKTVMLLYHGLITIWNRNCLTRL